MVWFKVDDSLHSHPKAMAASLAALGLWVVAGSWSSDHLTDGFVPDHMIPSLSRGTDKLAEELVAAGLWKRTRGGYLFHEWAEDGHGTKRNPTKKEVVENRAKRAEAGRKGGLASGKSRSKPGSKREANASADASGSVEPPSRPSPEGTRDGKGSQSSSRRNARGPDDDDSIDLAIVQLLAELTGREVSILWAAKVRQRILDRDDVRRPLAYVTSSIQENPGKFLPPDDEGKPPPPLKVVPEWCGYCSSDAYRWLELADDRWAKCPACNLDAMKENQAS
jgi:hypothetical protein